MSAEFSLLEFLENDNKCTAVRKHARHLLREQSDPFSLEETEFIRQYRLSKQLVLDLCDELPPMFKEPKKATDLSIKTKVLTTLAFYATGSYQRPIGGISAHSMEQSTVSKVIAQVTTLIDSPEMRKEYIIFLKTAGERNYTRTEFYQRFGIPGVLGCIDCTQISIIRPVDNEEKYFCRKHYHSLNVQLICNANMEITSVDASYGGATHDTFIWNNHPLKYHLENLNESTWLLGDCGYPLRKFMMTPIVDAASATPEKHYTDMHIKTRNLIERAIGLLKARFRCLLVHRTLHYRPQVAASIVNACVILHNICNKANIAVPELRNEITHPEMQLQVDFSEDIGANNEALQMGVATRNALIRHLWEARAV